MKKKQSIFRTVVLWHHSAVLENQGELPHLLIAEVEKVPKIDNCRSNNNWWMLVLVTELSNQLSGEEYLGLYRVCQKSLSSIKTWQQLRKNWWLHRYSTQQCWYLGLRQAKKSHKMAKRELISPVLLEYKVLVVRISWVNKLRPMVMPIILHIKIVNADTNKKTTLWITNSTGLKVMITPCQPYKLLLRTIMAISRITPTSLSRIN